MKALTGYAEWFWLMAKNIKPVENRNWSLASRGIRRSQLPMRIYLHAGKQPASKEEIDFIIRHLNPEEYEKFRNVNWNTLRGHIIGEITLVDEVTLLDIGMDVTKSPWFFGIYGFMVEDGFLYDKPIPMKGRLGFWEVKLEAQHEEVRLTRGEK